jgi:hypothetical protein
LEEAPFIVQDNGDLLVYTPPASAPGAVDVRVTTEKQTVMLPGGFEYTGEPGVLPDDPPDDTDDPGPTTTGNGPPGQPGQTVGVIEFSHMVYSCPDCLPGRPGPVTENAVAIFHDATDSNWNDWIPQVGSCDFGIYPPVVPVSTVDVGPTVSLAANSGYNVSLSRTYDASSPYPTLYDSGFLPTETLQGNASYTVQLSGGAWDPLTVTNAVQAVMPFSEVLPGSMFPADPNSQFQWPIRKSEDFVLNWDPATTAGTTVVVQIDFYKPDGSPRNNIVCQAADAGDVVLPPSLLTNIVVGDDALVTLYRFRKDRVALPGGTEIDVHYWFGLEGTAYVAP